MLANSCVFTPAADMEQHSFHFEVFIYLFILFFWETYLAWKWLMSASVRLNQNGKAIKPNQTALTLDAVIWFIAN